MEHPEHFKILPQICEWTSMESMIKGGKKVPEGFSYTSDNNTQWMSIMFAEKSWGSYHVLDVEERSMTVKVTLNPGHRMNYHSHDRRDEVWTVVSGTGKTIVDGAAKKVSAGDVITMPAGCKHTVIAETELQLIEVQIGDEISVSDKIKYELKD